MTSADGMPCIDPKELWRDYDFFVVPSGKRKREDFLPQVPGSGFIPQQDGAGDATYDVLQSELYPYQGVASEDYNTVNTPAGHELHAGTPAVAAPTEAGDVDDDEPPLNENDDVDLDDVEGEEPNMQHLVLAQFDKNRSSWNKSFHQVARIVIEGTIKGTEGLDVHRFDRYIFLFRLISLDPSSPPASSPVGSRGGNAGALLLVLAIKYDGAIGGESRRQLYSAI
ncbi:hypothetical protein Sjap_008080 [Stephania japonica]|uniref:Uncharacterized protein n=1 Tax=Stephania japonica TaxID=461633 RepID=A0AAP0PE51_9MAGN